MSGKYGFKKGRARAELLLIIFVIVICSAVAVPYVRGRGDKTRWSEGRATAVSIRTAADNYIGEKGARHDFSGTSLEDLGFRLNLKEGGGDLDGKFFTDDCFDIMFAGNGDYLITIDASKSASGDPPASPRKMTLDRSGKFSEIH